MKHVCLLLGYLRDINAAAHSVDSDCCIALLFSSFYGVVFEVFSSLTVAVARLF